MKVIYTKSLCTRFPNPKIVSDFFITFILQSKKNQAWIKSSTKRGSRHLFRILNLISQKMFLWFTLLPTKKYRIENRINHETFDPYDSGKSEIYCINVSLMLCVQIK